MIEPRRAFPRRSTGLVIVDTERWKVFKRIELEGDFSFDAISPDGSVLYFINYIDPDDPTKYEVRAYDTVPGELRADPVLDERTAPALMRGFPLTRVTSPDGAWEYTLYDGGGGTPFVHALNTVDATSICIDVPQLGEARNLFKSGLEIAPDGGAITVFSGREPSPVAEISTSGWEVSEYASPAPPSDGGEPIPARWALPAIGLFVAGLVGWLWRRRPSALPADPLPGASGTADDGRKPAPPGQFDRGEHQEVG